MRTKSKLTKTQQTEAPKVIIREPEWRQVTPKTSSLCVILGWNIRWFGGEPSILRCWYDWSENCWLTNEIDIREMQPTLYTEMPAPPLTETEVADRLKVVEMAGDIDFANLPKDQFDTWLESLPPDVFSQVVTMSDEVNRKGFARL